ncbi:MAG: twin-arginine translocase subunit TatC [Treponema sp.]|jgi:sec-independent protein translocase protein TatC|nr:twin-arginine translocase subunit TatC [Treponema sp.]
MSGPEKTGGKKGDSGESEWTEHLEELRRRIIAVLAVFCAAAFAAFVFSPSIAAFLLAPVAEFGVALYTFSPAEKFTAYLNLSVWTGAAAASPFFLLQAGLFVWPALRGRERRCTLAALTAAPVLFLGGAAAAYRFLAPVVMKFFLTFGAFDGIQPLWGFREYLGVLYALMLASGILLEAPLILLLAFAVGILSPAAVARLRAPIIVVIFFAAAVCTPPDVISQLALGIPLYLLFELTLLAGRFLRRN